MKTAGRKAAKRFTTFFTDDIENDNTRAAYLHAVFRFFEGCEGKGLGFPFLTGPEHRLEGAFVRVGSYHLAAQFLPIHVPKPPTVFLHLSSKRLESIRCALATVPGSLLTPGVFGNKGT